MMPPRSIAHVINSPSHHPQRSRSLPQAIPESERCRRDAADHRLHRLYRLRCGGHWNLSPTDCHSRIREPLSRVAKLPAACVLTYRPVGDGMSAKRSRCRALHVVGIGVAVEHAVAGAEPTVGVSKWADDLICTRSANKEGRHRDAPLDQFGCPHALPTCARACRDKLRRRSTQDE